MIQAATYLGLATLTAAIGIFWAQENPHSNGLFGALMACSAASGMLAILGVGELMQILYGFIAKRLARYRHGLDFTPGSYVPIDEYQPTL